VASINSAAGYTTSFPEPVEGNRNRNQNVCFPPHDRKGEVSSPVTNLRTIHLIRAIRVRISLPPTKIPPGLPAG